MTHVLNWNPYGIPILEDFPFSNRIGNSRVQSFHIFAAHLLISKTRVLHSWWVQGSPFRIERLKKHRFKKLTHRLIIFWFCGFKDIPRICPKKGYHLSAANLKVSKPYVCRNGTIDEHYNFQIQRFQTNSMKLWIPHRANFRNNTARSRRGSYSGGCILSKSQ